MSVKETDRELRARRAGSISESESAAWTLPHRFDRNSTSASNMNSNRGGTARRRLRGSRGCLRCRLAPEADCRRPRAKFLLPPPWRGRPVARAASVGASLLAPEWPQTGVRRPLSAREHCGRGAVALDRDRTGTCQQILLKAPGGELASRSANLPKDLPN